jgi:hypothetical protein
MTSKVCLSSLEHKSNATRGRKFVVLYTIVNKKIKERDQLAGRFTKIKSLRGKYKA